MNTPLFAVLLAVAAPIHAARAPEPGLSRADAEARARRVSDVAYALEFDLDADAPEFAGTVEAEFELSGADEDLTLDFSGGKVLSLEINGEKYDPEYNGFFLTLPAAALSEGPNRVVVKFSHPYSDSGAGLYRFKDPADGRSYLYTDFEPYDANRLFPCFDQPDLKARYALKVRAPEDWLVVTSVLEDSVLPAGPGRRLWSFPESEVFSTYIFPLHAGPYAEWKDRYEDVPLRLLARRSIAGDVDVEEWFQATKQGLAFFNAYFDYDYPFHKYDQVIVPDFNAGAMENVAAVTFSERFVHRGRPTRLDRMRRAGVILHEMAHMWFGNLVTMRWWDDLWLNESFATYMAYLALREATEFHDAWEVFHLNTKQWAYWEDGLVTTHPIEAEVPNTGDAFANFDGITYGKGASALKQAAFYLGADAFRAGVRRYFKRHAFGNTVRRDFTGALAEASGRDLDGWVGDWLSTPGTNVLRAEVACKGGKVSSLRLTQGAPAEHPRLRRHRAMVALLGEEGGKLRAYAQLPVEYTGAEAAVPLAAGKACPALVLPNHGDHDFAKLRLDPGSLETAKARLSDVDDALDRAMLWTALWDMVQDGGLSVLDYADVVLRHLPAETSPFILRRVAETLQDQPLRVGETLYAQPFYSGSVLGALAGDGPEWGALSRDYGRRLEALFREGLDKAEAGSDAQRVWFDAYVRLARTPAALSRLKGMLAGSGVPSGLELDQDRRWAIVIQLARLGAPGHAGLIGKEGRRDPSRRGQTLAIAAQAVRPDAKSKQAWLDRIAAGKAPLAELRAAMESLFPPEQAQLERRFAGGFYASLPALAKERPEEFLERYAMNLAPATCRAEDGQALARFLQEHPDLHPVAAKELKIAAQENGRCLKIRDLALKSRG